MLGRALRTSAEDLEDLGGQQLDTLEAAIAGFAHLAIDVRGAACVCVLHEEPSESARRASALISGSAETMRKVAARSVAMSPTLVRLWT